METFRPRTGDYFFIKKSYSKLMVLYTPRSFRPRTGDYFFIVEKKHIYYLTNPSQFPSPYWGLFFYR